MSSKKQLIKNEDFQSRADLGPKKNLEILIQNVQNKFPYKVNSWDENIWNITEYEKKKLGSRPKQLRLIFGLTSNKSGARSEIVEFTKNYSDLVKTIISIRFLERGVGFGPQQTLLIAFRYLYKAIANEPIELEDIQNRHFVLAAKLLESREASSTCYRIGNSLEIISKLLDRFYLTTVKSSFNSHFKRTDEYDPLSERTIERSSKLQLSESAIEGILTLHENTKDLDERLIIQVLKLLLFTGLRITELLSLDRNCLLIKVENGEEFVGIKYFPLKGGSSTYRIKWFGDLSGRLVRQCIYDIQKLTFEAHKVTKWLVNNPQKTYIRVLCNHPEFFNPKEHMTNLGLKTMSGMYKLLYSAKIKPPFNMEKFDEAFRPSSKDFIVFEDLKFDYRVTLDKALFVIFKNTYTNNSSKRIFHPMPLTEGVFNLVINGKKDREHSRKSIFEKYELKDNENKEIHITPHMFRRFLNTIYNEGGVPLTILTKIFGRKNPKDTLSYIYTTPKKRTEEARKLFKDGGMIGPKADILKKVSIKQRDEFIDTVVESIHFLGYGYCSHDWSTLPCEKHLQCLDKCIDFHIKKDDPRAEQYLAEQKEWAQKSLISALCEVEEGTYGASSQADHYRRVIDTADRLLSKLDKK